MGSQMDVVSYTHRKPRYRSRGHESQGKRDPLEINKSQTYGILFFVTPLHLGNGGGAQLKLVQSWPELQTPVRTFDELSREYANDFKRFQVATSDYKWFARTIISKHVSLT